MVTVAYDASLRALDARLYGGGGASTVIRGWIGAPRRLVAAVVHHPLDLAIARRRAGTVGPASNVARMFRKTPAPPREAS